MNILFWNTGRNNVDDCLLEMIIENDLDLLVLAEYAGDINILCKQLNNLQSKQYNVILNHGGCTRIHGLVCSEYIMSLLKEETHFQLLSIRSHKHKYELIVAMIHARSKLRTKDRTQEMGIRKFYGEIATQEQVKGTNQTLAIGDFNINPFDDMCIAATAMHAIPFRDAVLKDKRTVFEEPYRKFYNPTWRLFGKTDAPYTTYYYNDSGEDVNFYWYAYDQVIIRPSLIKAFNEEDLKIITSTTSHYLLNNNKIPDKINYSDHLPLFCSLKEDLI